MFDKDMNEANKFEPIISYPNYYLNDYNPNLHLSFDLYQKNKGIRMTFEKRINSKVTVVFNVYYSKREKILDKTLRLNLANADKYIEGQSKVKTYLTKYGITASDLAKHYNEIVNQKVLKDWCSISDSKFSPKDYGDVTVKTEWENW
ncbi:TipC family immunity protein [Streptococcus alactolyticus]|uniref:TipC family immunity protein n=1 Tax=Streptococcus alactolyticus TaxID=29389 RepID=UPI0039C6C900